MKRKEEIVQQSVKEFPRFAERRVGFITGAEWSDEHPKEGLVSIDKACEYWNNVAKQAEGEIGYYILSCLDEFREAMEE